MEKISEHDVETVVGEILNQGQEIFQECLATISGDDDVPALDGIDTFAGAGLLTRENGLVLKMSDGSEFQITIKRSR